MDEFLFFLIAYVVIFALPTPSFLSVLPKVALAYVIVFVLPLHEIIPSAEPQLSPPLIIVMLAAFFAGIVLFLAQLFVWRSPLERWAEAEALQLIHISRRAFVRGPFFWRSSDQQQVFHIAVQDGPERCRWGWVCLGGYLLGTFEKKAEVRWEPTE